MYEIENNLKLTGLDVRPGLDAAVLDRFSAEAADHLRAEGESENTVASYQSALRYISAWFLLRYGRQISVPVPVAAVLTFISDHLQHASPQGLAYGLPADVEAKLIAHGLKKNQGALALGSVVQRIAVLSKVHTLKRPVGAAEDFNPCASRAVRELLSSARRAFAARREGPRQKDALNAELLQAVLATCDDGTLHGVRDRALLLFAWSSGGRRRSEVADALRQDLRRYSDGSYGFLMGRSKTNQAASPRKEVERPVQGDAALAMDRWLERSGITDGRLFRGIQRGDRLLGSITPQSVGGIVSRRCREAGIEGDFSAHSLRSGFVTEAGIQQAPIGDGMAMTGHRSVEMFMSYYRPGDLAKSKAASLLATARRPGDNPKDE